MQQLSSPASVFCVAAPSDGALLATWERHLLPLQQAGHITIWSERHVQPGTLHMQQIHDHLDHAGFIVLLVSAAFFADDACVALTKRAIERAERSNVRLIPLLLRPVAWRESPLAPYPCMPSNNRPVTKWSNRDAAFEACVRDIRRLLGRPITAPLTRPHIRTEALQHQNRIRMLRRVRKIWIDGLLIQSLHDAARIELHLQDRPDVLEAPLRLQVQELDQAPKALPDGTTIVHVYDEADEELLILGEPGAGKTTLLLELTRALLERAEQDEQLCMPVVFNLSSWAEKREPLRAWLIEELWRNYQVPRKVGKAWIDADQVLPLLDGLDEVAKGERSACVKQINDYYEARLERGSSSIVVCCRSEEYTTLSTRITLQHTVSILPLTDSQINTYLEQAGEQVKGLRQALDEDTELHSLARQPLMLNVFTLAYQGATSAEIPTGEAHEEMRHTIFARYVEGMLKRRGQSKCWKPEQLVLHLTFLAKQMQQHDQAVFSVENLQPIWLAKMGKILFHCSTGLLFGLFSGLVGMLAFGLVGALAFGLYIGLVVGLATKIDATEAVIWSWKEARSGLVFGLVAGLVFGLVGGLGSGLLGGLGSGLAVGLGGGLGRGLSGRQMLERLFFSPNEGIWRSGKNGLVFGLGSGLVLGLFGGLLGVLSGGLISGILLGLKIGTPVNPVVRLAIGPAFDLVIGLATGLTVGLVTGLDAFALHFFLRFWLWHTNCLPWNLILFLDEAAERLLLRKVGGSYIFVHRQLLDYFASLDEPRQRGIE